MSLKCGISGRKNGGVSKKKKKRSSPSRRRYMRDWGGNCRLCGKVSKSVRGPHRMLSRAACGPRAVVCPPLFYGDAINVPSKLRACAAAQLFRPLCAVTTTLCTVSNIKKDVKFWTQVNKVGHRKAKGFGRYSFPVKSGFTDVWKVGQLASVTKIWRGKRHEKVDDLFFYFGEHHVRER